MTDPGPALDAGLACPFVAFDDDRDSRSTRPDHRHRCYAEARPAPRATAHQEAYCLSAGFARCPTFIDWARREAARATPEMTTVRSGMAGGAIPDPSRYVDVPADGSGSAGAAAAGMAGAAPVADEASDLSRKQSQRGWSAPPPWGSDQAASNGGVGEPRPDAGAGTAAIAAAGAAAADDAGAGTAAGGSAAGGPTAGGSSPDADAPSFLATRSSPPPIATPRPQAPVDLDDDLEAYERGAGSLDEDATAMRRFGPGTGRSRYAATSSAAARQRPPADPDAPPWERPRRFEAYPAIKTRRSMPGLSPILVGVAVIAIGALVLFFVPPMLLGLGGGDSNATPTPTRSSSASPADASPTPLPSPTPTIYVVKTGDTLSKIAKAHGVTLDALIAANKDTLKDPDNIKIGQQLVIPLPPSEEVPSPASPAASPSPSP